MTTKKPSELAREYLAKRTRDHIALINKTTPKSMLKSPSQKRSEAGRKKYLKRAGVKAERRIMEDCTDCPKNPCGKKILACGEPGTRYECQQCGVMVICYHTEPRPKYCPICRERKQ